MLDIEPSVRMCASNWSMHCFAEIELNEAELSLKHTKNVFSGLNKSSSLALIFISS